MAGISFFLFDISGISISSSFAGRIGEPLVRGMNRQVPCPWGESANPLSVGRIDKPPRLRDKSTSPTKYTKYIYSIHNLPASISKTNLSAILNLECVFFSDLLAHKLIETQVF